MQTNTVSHKQSYLGNNCEVYVTYVADVDKEQWHVVTLEWSIK